MKRVIAVLAMIMVLTSAVACGSAGQSGTGTPAKQEEAVEQEASADQEEAPVEQEESTDQEEAPVDQEASVDQAAATAQEASTEQAAVAAQEAAAEEAATTAQEAAAEQEDLYTEAVKSLFGEGGPLFGVLPAGTNVDEIVGTARDQMSQADQQIRQVLDDVAEKAQNEEGDLNLKEDTLKDYAEALLGKLMGSEDYEEVDSDDSLDFDSFDAYMEIFNGIKDSEGEYIKERNAGTMEAGDVQIVANGSLVSEEIENDRVRKLNCMIQNNYRMDEENQLWLVDSSEDVVLFTHQKDQDGNYPVADAEFAEKGENYESSIEALYLEMGESADEMKEDLEASRILVAFDLQEYLEEHPEVKGIEFEGEIRNAEELEEIMFARLSELYEEEE